MDKLLVLLLAGSLSTGAVLLSEQELSETYQHASTVVRSIGESNRAQTLEAAQILYQSDHNTWDRPSVQTLVDEGYLKPEFLETPTAP